MSRWRQTTGAATLSILLHLFVLWLVSAWNVATPSSAAADLERVVVSLAEPRSAAPAAAALPPPPPPPVAQHEEAAEVVEAPRERADSAPPPELEIPIPERQIVAVPDAGEERAPDDTRFLSDRDNVVEQESVRRGEPERALESAAGDDAADALAEPFELAAVDDADVRQAESEIGEAAVVDSALDDDPRQPPDVASLLPNALALAAKQARDAPTDPAQRRAREAQARASRRRSAAWEPSTTLRGTLDYLPDVRPGNVTLLNTKAEVFAPFVRRVMMRVFQNMMILLRRAAPSMRAGANEKVEAEAIMSPSGEMIGLRISERSTSMSIGLDRLLSEACEDAFFDRNPPPGAAAKDGNIHFILRTIVQTYPAAGRGGVGLSGLFGVGLL